jgi:hypothetical protein
VEEVVRSVVKRKRMDPDLPPNVRKVLSAEDATSEQQISGAATRGAMRLPWIYRQSVRGVGWGTRTTEEGLRFKKGNIRSRA